VLDRIGQVRVAWSEQMWSDAGPEVPDQRPAAWAQHPGDLGQASRRVGPVVHRQGADNQVEGSFGERQGGHVADDKRWPALVAGARAVGVGSGAGDHGRVQVEAGHLEPVVAGQPERQETGPAADLQDPGAVRGDRRDVGRDAIDERAEQEPAEGVVEDGSANENASGRLVPLGGMAALSQDRQGCGGRAGVSSSARPQRFAATSVMPRARSRAGAAASTVTVAINSQLLRRVPL